MESLRPATVTFATALENTAFLTSHWITPTRGGGASLDHDETSAHGAGPADSKFAEVREVCQPTETKNW